LNASKGLALESRHILGMRVDGTSYRDATDRIVGWARSGSSRSVCAAAVNNVMTARDDPSFLRVMNEADVVTPDGMPLVWALRSLGVSGASRVYGPDLTPLVCSRAATEGLPVGFFGSTPEVLDKLVSNATARLPGLVVAYKESPPFGQLSEVDDERITRDINASGARILFVGLGCPKQEVWMAQHRGKVNAVMVGVGAAFDFLAGLKPQAPAILQRAGLEWLFRLASEPRRLWRRYLRQNPRFAVLLARQLVADRIHRLQRRGVFREGAS
jgi:N-acetylglucosaminyldiphosphoundecaprenol N-acetyl-beta-D-mannosaminyltransferase